MSKDYKVYHRYLISEFHPPEVSTITSTEITGSGVLPEPSTTYNKKIETTYTVTDKSTFEVEELFKAKYPLQYMHVRRKFDKKLKKLLEANEEAV